MHGTREALQHPLTEPEALTLYEGTPARVLGIPAVLIEAEKENELSREHVGAQTLVIDLEESQVTRSHHTSRMLP